MMNKSMGLHTEQLLDEVEARMRAQFTGFPAAVVENLDPLILTDSQRTRPKITLLVGKMFSAKKEALISIAAAVEMLHTATLTHDKLVNHSDPQNARHPIFITSATVLTGDLAFAAAAQLAASAKNISIMQKFSETLQFIVNGGINDLFRNGNHEYLETYYNRIHSKTASIFEIATGMAATIGSANEAEIKSAYQFGYNLGMAFQIMKDVSAFSAQAPTPNQQIVSELQQGIMTLPTIFYQKMHPDKLDTQMLTKRNGNNQAQIQKLIMSIRQSEAIEQAIQEAHRFLDIGLQALLLLPNSKERNELERISKFEVHPQSLM
jgi:geranylgeranyl pyrophosphate synthase